MASDETVYCICRKPYDEKEFMIECEICKDWFHGRCVDIKEYQASDIEIYHCPDCQEQHGPPVWKRKRNVHRHSYSEENSGKATQTGSFAFIKELKSKTFPAATESSGMLERLRGHQLTIEHVQSTGFKVPILVDRPAGLDLIVPPPSFTIQDVEDHVGSTREIDVIDVGKQQDHRMLMREWTEYYNSPNRNKIYNVISLEFSNTSLASLVSPPRVVRELSWVHNYWPEQVPDDVIHLKPEVVRYCLMGVKDSFTDFHIDFGGTSVWYHVLRGEKIFYLIPPTPANMLQYEHWIASSQQEGFFGDQVEKCYKLVIKQGQTVFIPTGWIHGVFTPIDSLVFGGNFLHSLNVPLQIQVYDMEKRLQTEDRYMFPNYETINWYAAKSILELVKDYTEEKKKAPAYLIEGLNSLLTALKLWTNKKDSSPSKAVPETIQCGKLLNDIAKELKLPLHHHTKSKKKSKEDKKKRGKSSSGHRRSSRHRHSSSEDDEVEQNEDDVEDELLAVESEEEESHTSSKRGKRGKSGRSSSSSNKKQDKKKSKGSKKKDKSRKSKHKQHKDDSVKDEKDGIRSPLTLRIGKHSASPTRSSKLSPSDVYDFPADNEVSKHQQQSATSDDDDDDTGRLLSSTPMLGLSRTFGIAQVTTPFEPRVRRDSQQSDKSSLFSPKAVSHRRRRTNSSNADGGTSSLSSTPMSSPQSPQRGGGLSTPPYSPPYAGGVLQAPSWATSQHASSTSSLLDAAPMSSTLGLKLKLSNGKIVGRASALKGSRPHSSTITDSSSSEDDTGYHSNVQHQQHQRQLQQHRQRAGLVDDSDDDSDDDAHLVVDEKPKSSSKRGGKYSGSTDIASRRNMPEIRGGLNGSIADILEASGYGTATDFKVDEEIGSEQEAIQGMLSMSQAGGSLLTTGGQQSPFYRNRHTAAVAGSIAGKRGSGMGAHSVHPKKRRIAAETDPANDVCYNDDQYVYTTVNENEDEDRKPGSKARKDDTWRPSAKVVPTVPKPHRAVREGAIKESMETVLAASAARLSHPNTPAGVRPSKHMMKQAQDLSSVMDDHSSMALPSSSFGATAKPSKPSSLSSQNKPRRVKKGLATPKQRLSKILKIKGYR